MLGDQDSNIKKMEKKIYIQLLGEGTVVYRPVPAFKLGDNVYRVEGSEIYDPDDEEWEFLPGTVVIVEDRELEGEKVLVAVKNKKNEMLY